MGRGAPAIAGCGGMTRSETRLQRACFSLAPPELPSVDLKPCPHMVRHQLLSLARRCSPLCQRDREPDHEAINQPLVWSFIGDAQFATIGCREFGCKMVTS